MPWQGQADNLIDRFDVRAHLDYIPLVKKQEDVDELTYEERQVNYERYRVIAQNSFLGIQEEKFLKQLQLEEQFGYTEPESKKKKSGGVSIGFNYEEGTAPTQSVPPLEESEEENSDSDLDVDLYINVSKIDQQQAHEMNKHGLGYGMSSNDFYSFLTNDMEEAESNRLAREEEHEKALFSGRKSRRERRAHRERRLANRVISPPSYAARTSPTYPSFRESKSPSHSPSPENTGKITYITSFGGEDDPPSTSKPTYADKVKYGRKGKSSAGRRNSPDYRISDRRRRRSSSSECNSRFRRRRSRSVDSRNSKLKRRSISKEKYRNDRYRLSDRKKKYRSRKSRSTSSSSDRSKSYSNKLKSRSETKRSSSKSRSRSRSSRSSKSDSSKSSSSCSVLRKSTEENNPIKKDTPPKVLPRYYGRKRSDQSSSSDLDEASDMDTSENKSTPNSFSNDNRPGYGNAGSSFKKTAAAPVLSLQERLKRKRQALLNKQFKADKLAEQIKSEREKQEQQHREDELREMAIRLRRRQREIRHAYDSHNSSDTSSDSDGKKSRSSNRSVQQRSRSNSPRDRRSSGKGQDIKERSSRKSSPKRRQRDSNSGSDQEKEQRSRRRSDAKKEEYKRENYKRDEQRRDDYRRCDEPRKGESYSRSDDLRRGDYRNDGSRRNEENNRRPLVDY
ncbi:CLK4-associating serine/arginine rich protein isoform X2 [Agrilus planipennis]|nr:CLK4-associating serine/arginine rich protein isoform X2 [Agrilus planipennis]